MAFPLAGLYGLLARFGYGVAKTVSPKNVKSFLKPAVDLATTPKLQATKLAGAENLLIKGTRGAAKAGYKGYDYLYGAALGTPARRKITTGIATGYGISSFLDGDDIDEQE